MTRRTYNWRVIERLEQDNAALRANAAHDQQILAELYERYDAAQVGLAEAHQRIANQAHTLHTEQQTAEWAVESAWSARRELADHASGAVVAYVVIGAGSIVAWEMLAHLVAAVTR